MNLQNLAKKIQEKTLAAKDDLKDATNSTRPMREGNKKAAIVALEDLRQDYRRLLLATASYLVISGPQANNIEKSFDPENGPLSADPEGLYEDVLSRMEERTYMNRTADGTFLMALNDSLEKVGKEIGVQSYPQLNFKAEYAQVISKRAQALGLVRKIINNDIGGELVGIYTVSKLLNKAISQASEDSFTPIILTSKDPALALTLSNDLRHVSKNVFLVSVGKETPKEFKNVPNSITIEKANKESIEELFAAIKSRSV